jgi:hypothetical protein
MGREAFATRWMIRRSHDGDDSAELAGNTHLPWTLDTPLVTPEEFLTALPWTSCTVHELSGRRMLRHCTRFPTAPSWGVLLLVSGAFGSPVGAPRADRTADAH